MKQRHRAIGRIVARASIFLLLGAIVNIAVAWGCAAWSPQESGYESDIEVPQRWPSYLQDLGWPPPRSATQYDALNRGVGMTIIDLTGGDPSASYERSGLNTDRLFVSLMVRQFGMPWRSMQWEAHGVRAGPQSLEVARAAASAAGLRTGIEISEWVGASKEFHMRCLPLTAIWPGFALNTLFYAVILWLLFAAPFTLRRWQRIKRGLCPACAYPVGTSDVCTECGKPVKVRSVEPASS